jgi:hypothetical protein
MTPIGGIITHRSLIVSRERCDQRPLDERHYRYGLYVEA